MGYGILTVDFVSIKDALCLPENCKIISAQGATCTHGGHVDFLIDSPSLPDPTADHEIPRVSAICKQEMPENHVCPDGFVCKKITVMLEVSKY